MPRVPAAVGDTQFLALAAEQDDVLSWPQLRQHGITRRHVHTRVKAGAWQQIGRYVVVLHNGPLSDRQKLWVALLHGGPHAALGGLTAARADGLKMIEPETDIVLVPHGRNRADLEHARLPVTVIETRRLGGSDVHPARAPRRTRLPRSIVDAASLAQIDGRCRAIIAAAVQQRLVLPQELRTIAVERRTLPRRRLILETIDDVEGGAHSLPEITFSRAVRRVGLPEPVRQQVVQRSDGRWYLDVDYGQFEVTVEINGAQHMQLLLKEYDDRRRTCLAINGRLVVDLSSYTVRHHSELAVLIVADALVSRGWQPDPRVKKRLLTLAKMQADWTWTKPELLTAA